MHQYAQTYIQLLNQLQQNNYSEEELIRSCDAYKMAMELFAGCYRPSGKTFIAHIVGTASILASLHVPSKIAIAGLLHSVYTDADFGSWKMGVSNAKRKRVRAVVGEEVEQYLYRYATLKWNAETIPLLRDRLNFLDPIDRDVILMRLANCLEDYLDLGVIYCSNSKERKQFCQDRGDVMIEIAKELGFSTLAAELKSAFQSNILAEIPKQYHSNSEKDSFFITPKSFSKKISVVILEKATCFWKNWHFRRFYFIKKTFYFLKNS